MISNVGTATYHLAKYLTQLSKLLSKYCYTVKTLRKIRKQKIPKEYTMVSFDVVSLSTNGQLEDTINIILRRIYETKEILTDIPDVKCRELLFLCTKNVRFTFKNKIYTQNDVVAIASPLGQVLANIFMVEHESALIPNLSSKLSSWRRFVDDVFFVKKDCIKFVLDTLNNSHKNIKFTFEEEINGKIPFLDALLVQNNPYIDTVVYRKTTNTNLELIWTE